MNRELITQFFERDLSEEELGALREDLNSEDAALFFSERARLFQQALGTAAAAALVAKLASSGVVKGAGATASFFSTGSAILGKTLVTKAVSIALGAALVAGGAAVAYKAVKAPSVTVVTPMEAAPILEVAAPLRPAGRSKRPARTAAQPAVQRGKQLVIRLNLEEAASVETVVRNAQGQQVCSLGTLAVDAGMHRLVWNGRASDGGALAAGLYQVVTRWKGKEMVRWVELQPGVD